MHVMYLRDACYLHQFVNSSHPTVRSDLYPSELPPTFARSRSDNSPVRSDQKVRQGLEIARHPGMHNLWHAGCVRGHRDPTTGGGVR